MAIARYAANMANIAGKTNDEKAFIDMMADAVLDMREAILKVPFAPEEEKVSYISFFYVKLKSYILQIDVACVE